MIAVRVKTEDMNTDQYTPTSGTLTIFSTTWCGYCANLKRQLDSKQISYTEVDIEANPQAAHVVAEINGGNRVVPTVVFPDGSTATNPSLAEVRQRLG